MRVVHEGIDKTVRRVLALNPALRFFSDGWGDLAQVEVLRRYADDLRSRNRVEDYFEVPHIEWRKPSIDTAAISKVAGYCTVREGSFEAKMSSIVPPPARQARFLFIEPSSWKDRPDQFQHRPVAFLLAPTGDHGFIRRATAEAFPLAKRGIGSVLLMAAFAGSRRPKNQIRSYLRGATDLVTLGAAAFSETNGLMQLLQGQHYGPFVMSGSSLGAIVAGLIGSSSPFKPGLVPVACPDRAQRVFLGVFDKSIDWRALQLPGESVDQTRVRLDELYHLSDILTYPRPNPDHSIVVSGSYDHYVAGGGAEVAKYWQCEHVEVPAGHVSGFFLPKMLNAKLDSIVRVVDKMKKDRDAGV